MTDINEFAGAPVEGSSLREALPNRLARVTTYYVAEYGVRYDDGAVVFQFFPPDRTKDSNGSWDPSFKMPERLEKAMPQCFRLENLKAVFTEELNSFCIIVKNLGVSPDPWPIVERFFSVIDAPL